MASMSLQDLPERRIVMVGGSGTGKSSLGNTLFGEKWFDPSYTFSGTTECKSATNKVMNTQLTLVDTPGLFNTDKSEEDLKSEIIRSITECSPGPHAFLIVLKVEKYSPQEEEVVNRIIQYFSEEVLKYSVIVFTHGEQLNEGTTIQQFVDQNQKLKDVVRKCGGRCHVFDSKYWKNNNPEEKYRNNSYQLKELLYTVEKLVIRNNGNIYTNEMLQQIQMNEELIRQSGSGLSDEEIRKRAKHQTRNNLLAVLVGVGAGLFLGALFGAVVAAVVGASVGIGASIGGGIGAVLGGVIAAILSAIKKSAQP